MAWHKRLRDIAAAAEALHDMHQRTIVSSEEQRATWAKLEDALAAYRKQRRTYLLVMAKDLKRIKEAR